MKQDQGSAEGKDQTDPSSDDAKSAAGDRLLEFLDEIHATLPDVPEKEAQKAIEESIAAIRNHPNG